MTQFTVYLVVSMRLDLRKIRTPHERFEQEYQPEAFAAPREDVDGFRIASPVRLAFETFKDKSTFRLVGSTKTTLEVPCSRCLEPLVVPVDPITVLQQQGSPVPLLLGSNREESTGFGDHTTPLITSSAYSTAIHQQFDTFGSGVADQILALYPVSDYDTVNYALIAVHSDYKISCQARKVALAASGSQRPPVWRFLFTLPTSHCAAN